MKTSPSREALELKTPYPFTHEFVNKAPCKMGVYTLMDAERMPMVVAVGTLASDMRREASRQALESVKWFVIETIDGTPQDMQDYAQLLKTAYNFLRRKNKKSTALRSF
jgi:hypothetical protein